MEATIQGAAAFPHAQNNVPCGGWGADPTKK
jgi:hypothetical protein